MAVRSNYRNRIELLQGTLDMLILRTLQWGHQHGHGIGQAIRANSGELLQVETGSLYPALHRLERQGWLASEWGESENRRKAKYYKLTRTGRRHLETETANWERIASAIFLALDATS